MAALLHFVDAGQVIVLGVMRGVLDTNIPIWIASVSYWLLGLLGCRTGPVSSGAGRGSASGPAWFSA